MCIRDSPATDKDIFVNYSANDFRNKADNKRALQELMNLPQRADEMCIRDSSNADDYFKQQKKQYVLAS